MLSSGKMIPISDAQILNAARLLAHAIYLYTQLSECRTLLNMGQLTQFSQFQIELKMRA